MKKYCAIEILRWQMNWLETKSILNKSLPNYGQWLNIFVNDNSYVHLNFTRSQQTALVIDDNLKVATLVYHNDVIRVHVMNDFIAFDSWNSNGVKYALVLPRTKRHQSLCHNLKHMDVPVISIECWFLKCENWVKINGRISNKEEAIYRLKFLSLDQPTEL